MPSAKIVQAVHDDHRMPLNLLYVNNGCYSNTYSSLSLATKLAPIQLQDNLPTFQGGFGSLMAL